jgi:hypothetical protein
MVLAETEQIHFPPAKSDHTPKSDERSLRTHRQFRPQPSTASCVLTRLRHQRYKITIGIEDPTEANGQQQERSFGNRILHRLRASRRLRKTAGSRRGEGGSLGSFASVAMSFQTTVTAGTAASKPPEIRARSRRIARVGIASPPVVVRFRPCSWVSQRMGEVEAGS